MIRKVLAALFLFPASFFFYKDDWLHALYHGPWYFFGSIVKTGQSVVCKRGALFNLFIFYPMRVGMELVRRRPLKNIFLQARQALRKNNPEGSSRKTSYPSRIPLPQLSCETLRRIVVDPDIELVSFDIFDTLLTRPVISDPREIFHLVAARVNDRYKIDFVGVRWNAEAELGDPYANIDDIYAHIANKHNFNADLVDALKKEELLCERTLLQPKSEMLELCRLAAESGKRVVAVSDMYLPASLLLEILHEKGYVAIENVYVSAEAKVRKSDGGALFRVMLQREGKRPQQVLHLGDNEYGDIAMALLSGIVAIHIPSVRQMLADRGGELVGIFEKAALENPLWGILTGHALERIFASTDSSPECLERCTSAEQFVNLAMGPLLTALTVKTLAVAESQERDCIYYASRDGWLPKLAHNLLASCGNKKARTVRAVYFQAGRRAYFPFLTSSFLEYAKSCKVDSGHETFTLVDFLRAHFGVDADRLLTSMEMSEEESHLPFYKNKSDCLTILQKHERLLEEEVQKRRENAKKYYTNVFQKVLSNAENRPLVFDIGYSGSISKALTQALDRPVDKIYCWQNKNNQIEDQKNNTKTFELMHSEDYCPYHLVLEEMFSPCCGGAQDFDSEGKPILEDFVPGPQMCHSLHSMQKASLAFVRSCQERFGSYLNCFSSCAPEKFLPVFQHLFSETRFDNRKLFRNIVFPDPIYFKKILSLEQKIDREIFSNTVFSATGFENYDNVLPLASLFDAEAIAPNQRLGIHFHIYNAAMAQECARYLQGVPLPFDLFITHTRESDKALLNLLFNKAVLPLTGKIQILQTPNRGRDVAPWLHVAACAREYDLFCHVHAKESPQTDFAADWRHYLLDNLLRPHAVRAIMTAFSKDATLGLVFPAIFSKMKGLMTWVNVPLYGSEQEYAMICDALVKMGLAPTYARHEQFFSVGTMFWYRPKALQPLFDCAFVFDDFPPEPIGVGGTLAHAMERIPPLVCTRNGYRVRSLTCFESDFYQG